MSPTAAARCLLWGALALGCAGADDGGTGVVEEPVIGGNPSGPEDDAVVRLRSSAPSPYSDQSCSGTLVAPNLVLTALHCVSVFDGQDPFICRSDGSLDARVTGGWIGQTLAPESVAVYFGNAPTGTVAAHGVRIIGTGSTVVCQDDIALVLLDAALPARGLPIRMEHSVSAGEPVTVIGFGLSDQPDQSVIRIRRAGIPVLGVGPADTTTPGPVAPRTFLTGDGPCDGDFGGPALSEDTGAIAGVFAFNLGGNCRESGTLGWFTHLAPYETWLASAFDAAGAVPQVEATPASAPSPRRTSGCALGRGVGPTRWGAAGLAFLGMLLAWRRGREARWAP